VLEHIAGELGDAEPRAKDGALALAPLRRDLLDPAVDGDHIVGAHPEGSGRDRSIHVRLPASGIRSARQHGPGLGFRSHDREKIVKPGG
jgi:hypothetical protein